PCRLAACGDGFLTDDEECDDGNSTGRDGCSAICRVEGDWICPAPGRACRAPESGAAGAGGDGGTCGDGTVTPPEECDDGAAANAGDYGGCTADCQYAAYCGDGVVQAPEQCDSGVNRAAYGAQGACAPGCRFAHYCGDSIVDVAEGESCDYGTDNGACRHCSAFAGP
ncbi:MAG TPA: DUF4215 domain-containing protein, partial [Polyangiaceae bacterium]|nr:DUF4215 domain-containing protein [Polyangiaceae bacterium]